MNTEAFTQRDLSLMELYNKLYSFYGPQRWWPGETPFEVAVGAILTQNTNWSNVEKAVSNLKNHNILNAKDMHKVSIGRLASLIRPSGYYNLKAKRLKSFINFIFEEYDYSMARMKEGQTLSLRKKLLAVNGIGQETADSILLYALDKPVFVIDLYTKRILSRHDLMSMNSSYEDYQNLFHRELDKDVRLFNEYHALVVRVGKEHCSARPRCAECPLSVEA